MKRKFIIIALFALTIMIELLFSNNPSDLFISAKETTINLAELKPCEKAASTETGLNFFANGAAYRYTLTTPLPIKNIYLQFEGGSGGIVTGSVRVKDENFSNQFITLNEFQVNPKNADSVIVPAKSSGNAKEIEIVLKDGVIGQPVLLRSAVLNKETGLRFHFVRWFLMALCLGCALLIKKYALADKIFNPDNMAHFILAAFIILINMTVVFLIGIKTQKAINIDANTSLKTDKTNDIPYPLEKDISSYSIMVQQFDAFQKGQLYLDLDTDGNLAKLNALENPYDYSQREAANFNLRDWDHVYYNGKFYSYFGIAPILTIYYPHYWLTGTLPSDAKTGMILALIFVSACVFLIMRLISCFHLRINLLSVYLTMFTLPSASMAFLIQASSDFYYLPYLSAYASIACFLYASLTAYEYREQLKKSVVWFIGAGICLVLAVASRPTVIVPAFCLILPLYLHLLADKQMTVKQKSCCAAGFAAPTAIGAVLIMLYNYARFDSPFEFGAVYQLTASDIHFNKITLGAKQLWSYIHHYWLHQFTWNEQFPFLDYAAKSSFADGRFTFHPSQIYFAVFSIPLNLFLLTTPFLLKGRKRYQKAMLISGLISSFMILYIAFCVGGIQIRYIFDALFILTLLSCLAAWKVIDFFSKIKKPAAVHAVNFVLILSTIIGYLLIFQNERNFIKINAPNTYLYLKNLFTII